MRTGSEKYTHSILANGWVRQGYKGEGGYLFKEGERYEIREEKELFQIIGIPFVEPEERDI